MKFTSSRKREIKTVSWDVTKTGKGKMKKWENEKMGTKQRIGNEVTDRARVQEVLFPFFVFPFPARRVPRFSNNPASFMSWSCNDGKEMNNNNKK